MMGSSKGEHGELFYLKAAVMAASSQDAQAAADTTAASFQDESKGEQEPRHACHFKELLC